MPDTETKLRRSSRSNHVPKPETLALLKVSGNPINGLYKTTPRRPSPFFWHPPDQHPYGELQTVARQSSRKCPGAGEAFAAAYQYPELVPVAESRTQSSPAQFTTELITFALAHEADEVGIAPMNPLYVFEGYRIDEPWVIVLALAHNYERLKQVPSDEANGVGVCDIGDQYARGTRSSYNLANWIRAQGYHASPYPGPSANALLLIPPAIEAGLGELGKHGSLISPRFGSGVRLAGVTTDMPLTPSKPARFGGDEFCQTCQICARACPPTPLPNKNRWFAASTGGMSTSTSASPTSARTHPVESALPCVPGPGLMCVQSCLLPWPNALVTAVQINSRD